MRQQALLQNTLAGSHDNAILTEYKGLKLHLSSTAATGYKGVVDCGDRKIVGRYRVRVNNKSRFFDTAVEAAYYYASDLHQFHLESSELMSNARGQQRDGRGTFRALVPCAVRDDLIPASDLHTLLDTHDETVVAEYNGVKLHLSSKSSTGYKGVTRHRNAFVARTGESQADYIGMFDSALDAALAYATVVDAVQGVGLEMRDGAAPSSDRTLGSTLCPVPPLASTADDGNVITALSLSTSFDGLLPELPQPSPLPPPLSLPLPSMLPLPTFHPRIKPRGVALSVWRNQSSSNTGGRLDVSGVSDLSRSFNAPNEPVRAASAQYDSDEHDIELLNSSFEHDPPEIHRRWTGSQYPLLKQFMYTPGQGGVQRQKHRDPMRGWQLVTTTSFEQGDIVVGMQHPAKCGSNRAWQKLRADHGWPSDAAVQCNGRR